MTLLEWFELPCRDGQSFKEYLAQLIILNRGQVDLDPATIGKALPADNPWGRTGLTFPEALDFSKMCGVVNGFLLVLEEPERTQLVQAAQEILREQQRQLMEAGGKGIVLPNAIQTKKYGSQLF